MKYYTKAELRKYLNDGMKCKYASEFSTETLRAISEAVDKKNTDDEIRQLAWLVVDHGLLKYQYKMMAHFGVTKKNINFDDYKSEFFLIIMENLKKWAPEKGSLITYFDPYFQKACMEEKTKASNFNSRYYETVYMDMQKARDILHKNGVLNPELEDIKNTIEDMGGPSYSLKTLKATDARACDVTSIDTEVQVGTDDFADEIIERESRPYMEYSERIFDCIKELKADYRLIMEVQCRFHANEDSRKRMTDRELHEEIAKITGYREEFDLPWVKRTRQIAERQFIHSWNVWGKRESKLA